MEPKSRYQNSLEAADACGKFIAASSRGFRFFTCAAVVLLCGCGISIGPFGKTNSSIENNAPEEVQASPAPENPEEPPSPTGVQEVVELEKSLSGELLIEEAEKFHWIFQGNVRAYRSSNYARSTLAGDGGASATEYTVVGHLAFPKIQNPPFASTLSPSLTLLGQRAYFGQYEIDGSDSTDVILQEYDYEFRSVILDGEANLPFDWNFALSLGYDELLDFRGYEKLYHAVVPSVSFDRNFVIAGNGLLNLEVSADYALTKIYSQYEVPGVFDDEGDNLRTSLNLTLTKSLDSSGSFYLTPSASLMRTVYTKPDAIGRVDYLIHAEIAALYRVMSWLHLRAFTNYQDKMGNVKAKDKLGEYAEYENWDAGLGLGTSISF